MSMGPFPAPGVIVKRARRTPLSRASVQIHGLHRRFACRILSRMNRIQSELRRRRSPLP